MSQNSRFHTSLFSPSLLLSFEHKKVTERCRALALETPSIETSQFSINKHLLHHINNFFCTLFLFVYRLDLGSVSCLPYNSAGSLFL